jgi:hypothetical protein
LYRSVHSQVPRSRHHSVCRYFFPNVTSPVVALTISTDALKVLTVDVWFPLPSFCCSYFFAVVPLLQFLSPLLFQVQSHPSVCYKQEHPVSLLVVNLSSMGISHWSSLWVRYLELALDLPQCNK